MRCNGQTTPTTKELKIKPAARKNDRHYCPAISAGTIPHVGGEILSGSNNININHQPAARIDDVISCQEGSVGKITSGSGSVTFNHKSAAYQQSQTSHGGKVTTGSANVYIGDGGDPVAFGSNGFIEVGNRGQIFIGGASSSNANTQSITRCKPAWLKLLKNPLIKPIYGKIKIKLINDYDDYQQKNPPYFTERTSYTLIYPDKNLKPKIIRQKIQHNEITIDNFDLTQNIILQLTEFIIAINDRPIEPNNEITIFGLNENKIQSSSTKSKIRTVFLTILHPPVIIDLYDDSTNKKLTDNQLKYFKGKGNNATIFIHGFNVPKGNFTKLKLAKQLTQEINALPNDARYDLSQQKYHKISNNTIDATIYQSLGAAASAADAGKKMANNTNVYFDPLCIKKIEITEVSLILKLNNMTNHLEKITNGTGACNWLIHMEDNFNQATEQFDRSDYRSFTRFINIFWPGDIDSPLNYMQAVINANKAGKKLITLIKQLQQAKITINIVAHSAGNIVLLQLMNLLGKQKLPPLDHVFLWQAAVPNNALNGATNTNKNYNYPYAHQAAKKIVILYSEDDNILGIKTNGIFDTLSILKSKLIDPTAGFEIAVVIAAIICINSYYPPNKFGSVYQLGNLFEHPLSYFLKSRHNCETFYQNWISATNNHHYYKHGIICAFAPNLTMQTNQLKIDYPVLFTQLYIFFLSISQNNLHNIWPLEKQYIHEIITAHCLNSSNITAQQQKLWQNLSCDKHKNLSANISASELIQILTKSSEKISNIYYSQEDKFRQNIDKTLNHKSICNVVTIIISVLASTNIKSNPAMGYSGPDASTKKLLNNKLQLIAQKNKLLTSHSAMKLPTEELMLKIYQQQIWQKNPNFKFGDYKHENNKNS